MTHSGVRNIVLALAGIAIPLVASRAQSTRFEVSFASAVNIYSDVQRVKIGEPGTTRLTLSKVVPLAPRSQDTEWVKYVRTQSAMLTKFWGRPVYVNATILLPKGYNEHPDVRYPVIYT